MHLRFYIERRFFSLLFESSILHFSAAERLGAMSAPREAFGREKKFQENLNNIWRPSRARYLRTGGKIPPDRTDVYTAEKKDKKLYMPAPSWAALFAILIPRGKDVHRRLSFA